MLNEVKLLQQDRFLSLNECLEKWGAWARGRVGPARQKCRGLESRYRPEDAAPEQTPGGESLADYVGLEVERVANLLPRWQRDLLVLHYVRKLRPQQIVRALGLRFSEFEAHLRTSALMIDNKLRRNGVDIVLKVSL